MNLEQVMDEIGDALDVIPDLYVFRYPADEVTPPAALVLFPSMDFDRAMQRGLDRWTGGIRLVVADQWDQAARAALSKYTSGSGPSSIKAAIQAHEWQSCSFVRVVRADPEQTPIAGVSYAAYLFELDIAGPGDSGD